MEILKYSIDIVKDFPLKQYFTINKGYEYILGIVTKNNIEKDILDKIEQKSSKKVIFIGSAFLNNDNISFFEIKNITSGQPLLNSINRYLGNQDILKVNFIPSLKEMCIGVWGNLIYSNISINNIDIDVRCL